MVLSWTRGWCRGNLNSTIIVQNNVNHTHADMSREPLVKEGILANGII
jgi:hypothetical protein